jgi:imidazolonepropionase-like amidohydrolase
VWRQPHAIVIRHATVLPASGPAIEDGAIAFAAGLITAVGKNDSVATPAGAEEIDGRGKFISPGLIDVHSHLGVYPSPNTQGNTDGNEASNPNTAEVSAEHGFWPQDPGLRRAAAGGITSMLVLPGSANLIGGRGFPVKLHFGRTADEMRFPGAKDGLKMACGENPKRVYGTYGKQAPTTRMGNVAGYRQAFAQAREYMNKGGKPRDLKLETLAGVLRGEILVQNHCYRADEMQIMLDVAAEFGFHIRAFHHALEGYKLRDVLAARGVAIATWADWWGFKMEAYDGIPENAGLMTEAGGRAIIHSDSEIGIQHLNQEAAKALAHARAGGIALRDEQALRWITLNAAWAMGVDDRTGSLDRGKMADIVLWNRHPFSMYARAESVYVDGVLTYDLERGPVDVSDFELGRGEGGPPITPPQAPPAMPPPGSATPLPVPNEAAPCTVIRDAMVLADSGRLDRASVLVKAGKIATIAPSIPADDRCQSVDGAGRVLAPGFIAPSVVLGLVEVDAEPSASDLGARGTDPANTIHAAIRADASLNPAADPIVVVRLAGITTAIVAPQGGLIAGQSAALSTAGEILRAPTAMHAQLGAPGGQLMQSTRGAALASLREALDDAREMSHRRPDFDQNRMRKLAASKADLEALQPVASGRLPLVVSVDRASDIRALLAFAHDTGTHVIVLGGGEAWQVADELAAAKVPVILRELENLPSSFDRRDVRQDSAALLTARGVKVMLLTAGEDNQGRTLAQAAGNAVAWGLRYDDAFATITANVADAFHLEGGRIARGARADLVLWNGDPLETMSLPVAMWVAGKPMSLASRQTALLHKYRTMPDTGRPPATRK